MLTARIEAGAKDQPAIVLLHGRGSDEGDLFPLGRMLHPSATVVAVRAPYPAAPWGYGPGYAWYRFLGGTTPEPDSFIEGQEELAMFIASLPRQLGFAPPTIILGGFSQGATSSLACAIRNPGSVDAVQMFSGFLASHPSVEAGLASASELPVFWGHGDADSAMPFEHAESGWERLRAAGVPLESHRYAGMSHTISKEELADAMAWIEGLVSR